jgi:hypothetical protein
MPAEITRRNTLKLLAATGAVLGAGYPDLARAQSVPVQVPAPRGDDVSAEAKALRKARWTPERANRHMARFGVIKGCNYVTQDASSPLAEASERLVDRELGWAQDVTLSSIRVFISAINYQEMGDGLFSRLDRLMDIAAKHNLSFIPVLVTNNIRDMSYKPDPAAAAEPRPIPDFLPGVHGGPKRPPRPDIVSARQDIERVKPVAKEFVQAFLRRYSKDQRIVCWDLFNEPVPVDRPMVEYVFGCAREVNPSQPLTATWQGEDLSDVYSFHTYGLPGSPKGGEPELLPFDAELKQALDSGRPLLCTECLARTFGNTFEAFLPYFSKYNVGWYIWGLCAGTAQHHYPWRWPVGAPEPKNWFHCILYPDGTPYRDREIELIRAFKYSS